MPLKKGGPLKRIVHIPISLSIIIGLWVSKEFVEEQKRVHKRDAPRKSAVYKDLGDGWLLDTDLMKVYQRHMK